MTKLVKKHKDIVIFFDWSHLDVGFKQSTARNTCSMRKSDLKIRGDCNLLICVFICTFNGFIVFVMFNADYVTFVDVVLIPLPHWIWLMLLLLHICFAF